MIRARLLICALLLFLACGCHSNKRRTVPHVEMACSPDGKYALLVTYSHKGHMGSVRSCRLVSLENGWVRSLPRPRGYLSDYDWHPNSKYVAFLTDRDGLKIMDVSKAHWETAMSPQGKGEGCISWSPSGRMIAWVKNLGRRSSLLLVKPEEREMVQVDAIDPWSSNYGPAYRELDWSPDEKLLFFRTDRPMKMLKIQARPGYPPVPVEYTQGAQYLDVSPNGATALVRAGYPRGGGRTGWIKIVDLSSPSAWVVSNMMGNASYSPDGKNVLYDVWSAVEPMRQVNQIWIRGSEKAGKARLLVKESGGGVMPGAWTPQNKIMFLSVDRRSLWSIRPDGSQRRREAHW